MLLYWNYIYLLHLYCRWVFMLSFYQGSWELYAVLYQHYQVIPRGPPWSSHCGYGCIFCRCFCFCSRLCLSLFSKQSWRYILSLLLKTFSFICGVFATFVHESMYFLCFSRSSLYLFYCTVLFHFPLHCYHVTFYYNIDL